MLFTFLRPVFDSPKALMHRPSDRPCYLSAEDAERINGKSKDKLEAADEEALVFLGGKPRVAKPIEDDATRPELIAKLKALGVPGADRMKKDELIAEIAKAEAAIEEAKKAEV